MKKQYMNEKCNCGSNRKYKNCCGQKNNTNSDNKSNTNSSNWNFKENISAFDMCKALREFINNKNIDFTLFLMGETDYGYLDISKPGIMNWYDQCQQEIEMDYYSTIQFLGYHLDQNRFDLFNQDQRKLMIFLFYGLSYFLQSDSYRDHKGTLKNNTLIITFFKHKDGSYFPHIIGLTPSHPSNPSFTVSSNRMISLCMNRRYQIYNSPAVNLIRQQSKHLW